MGRSAVHLEPPVKTPPDRIRRVCAAILCAAALSAAAAEPPAVPAQPLTLVQLTDLALSNNPSTRLAWASIRNSEAGLELARSGYWPELDLDYGVTRQKQVNFTGGANSAQTRYGPGVSLTYLLWDFGTRSGAVDAAKYSLSAAHLAGDQTMQDLVLTVEQDYYQVLGLAAVRDADAESVRDASANLDAAKQRKSSGLATVGDVYQAEAALAGARLALQQAEGQLAVARGQLAVDAGFAADTDVPLEPWDPQVTPQLPSRGIRQLLDQAKDARPEVLAAKAREQAALASLESTEGQGWPSLALSATAGRTTTDIAGQHTNANNYAAGVTLSFPLFAGFSYQAADRQAQAAVDTAQASTQKLLQQVELEVWQAYQNLHTAAAGLETSDAQLKSAQQAADVTQARYKNGLGNILDMLSAEATLANARVQEVQARLNWFAAQAAMGHAMGGLDAPKTDQELP